MKKFAYVIPLLEKYEQAYQEEEKERQTRKRGGVFRGKYKRDNRGEINFLVKKR